MSIRVDLHENLQVIQISVDGEALFIRRDQATEFLAAFMRALAGSINTPSSVPELRLVGGFACDPDESGGAA